MPSFHVLIASIGRESLQLMLNSLIPQLNSEDHITIVFDGVAAIPMDFRENKCKIHVCEEKVNLGFYGHAIRNKYANILEKTDFIMHADDDDTYFPNAFDNLRLLCDNKNTLYVARMLTPAGPIPFPKKTLFQSIKNNYIGTPCGIIPYKFNSKAIWELRHGGDQNFYETLEKNTTVKFLNIIIYHVPTWIK